MKLKLKLINYAIIIFMNQLGIYLLILIVVFTGCNTSHQEEKTPYLTLRNLHQTISVPTNATLYLEFSKDIEPDTVNENTFFVQKESGEKVEGSLHVQSNRVSFTPTHYLEPLADYLLTVKKDLLSRAGYGLFAEYRWHFSSDNHADTTAPSLTYHLPSDNASIHSEIALQFNESILANTPALQVKDADGNLVSGQNTLENDILRFSPEMALSANTSYFISLTQNVIDLYGNEYNGTKQWTFSTSTDENSQSLDTKEITSLNTQTPLFSILMINDLLIAGSENSISTYHIDALTCKLNAIQSLALSTPAYVIKANTENTALLVGSTDGVHILSLSASGQLEESNNTFYATQAPVYDIEIQDDIAFLAQTTLGIQAIDISHVENPIMQFESTQIQLATEIALSVEHLYVADNAQQEIFSFSHEGSLIDRINSNATVYDLAYDSNTQNLYMSLGLGGLVDSSQQPLLPARSFMSKLLELDHQKHYKLINDKNRGVVLLDDLGASQSFISYKKALFGLANKGSCTFLAYGDGLIQAVDIFAPYVIDSSPSQNGSLEEANQSIVLHFDGKLEAASLTQENLIFTDDSDTAVAYTLSYDGDKSVSITPQSLLHVKHQYRLHVNHLEDLYHNIMSDPFILEFGVNYLENIAPQANDDVITMQEDTTTSLAILDNDSDVNGDDTLDKTSVHITQSPSHGSVTVNASGIAYYQPNADYFGADSFAYTVKDLDGAISNVATVSISITDVYDPPPNHAPQANDDTAIYGFKPTGIDVLNNDLDVDGNSTIDPTTVTITQGSSYGSMATLSVNPSTGVITVEYDPSLTSFVDTFKYTVKDTSGATSNEATVTVSSY